MHIGGRSNLERGVARQVMADVAGLVLAGLVGRPASERAMKVRLDRLTFPGSSNRVEGFVTNIGPTLVTD
jgi:hypothetical protein